MRLIVAVSLAFAVGVEPVGARLELPQELRVLAAELGCAPVAGYFERGGMIDPPYLYGFAPGRKDQSVAFWCERDAPTKYLLISMLNQHFADSLPWEHFPGGLSLYRGPALDLGEFVYADEPGRKGPTGTSPTYPPLVSYYDGIEDRLYRHEGRWLMQSLH